MKTILDTIIAQKHKEVTLLKEKVKRIDFEKQPFFNRETISLSKSLLDSKNYGIISEFKRQSPSKGVINDKVSTADVCPTYQKAGAAGLSILTDKEFFGGSIEDVLIARPLVSLPILRKEFIVDEIQILEAKAIGADAILLIAECLDKKQLNELTLFAQNLGLEVLIELHEEAMIEKLPASVNIVGVNNRNLKTFEVTIDTSLNLYDKLPSSAIKISESGVSQVNEIHTLSQKGFKGFLIGENFMKNVDPGQSCMEFIRHL